MELGVAGWIMSGNSARDLKALGQVLELGAIKAQQRVMGMGLIALTFVGFVGWRVTALWLLVAVVLQLILGPALALIARQAWSLRTRLSAAAAAIAFSHGLNGALAIAAAVMAGPWGFVLANLFLVTMVIFGVRTGGDSRLAFYAALGPYSLQLVALPVIALIAHAPLTVSLVLAFATAVLLVHFYDVWRRNQLAMQALADARDRAEAATEAKSAFVAMVSHELRTPISGILAGSAVLEAAAADRSSQSHAVLIGESARMMRMLLNDLLDLSKIEAGRMSIERVRFDLRRLIQDAVAFWGPDARARGLRFRLQGARNLPRWVEGDPMRIRQVINNLISNALKFTDQGSITLAFSISPSDAPAMRLVEVRVVDTGAGMTPDQMSRLFTAYDQLSDGRARTHGGTGLGLNISRQLAGLMEGALTASSAAEVGTTFSFTVPLTMAEAPASSARADVGAGPQEGLRVLIVDDHDVNRRAFSLILEPFCREIRTADNGACALEILQAEPFDLVLLDINMPVLGGFEAASRVRAEPGPNQATPIIALSASVDDADVRTCFNCGMNGFVRKPIEAAELFAAIEQILSHDAQPASAHAG